MKEKKIIYGVLILSISVWIINLLLNPHPEWNVWVARKELIHLTGIIAFTYMGLIMLLSVRPKWLEKTFHGLDKMYYIHKWAGIWAIVMSAVHYLLDLSGNILIMYFEKGPKGPKVETIISQLKPYAKIFSEYMVWLLLVILVITLWNRFAYHIWRRSHKVMGAVFLILVFHSIVLAPPSYWTEPAGLLFALISIVGSICAVISLFGLIGKQAKTDAKITDIQRHNGDLIEITCQLSKDWEHKAGQYAFFSHKKLNDSHPFTISSGSNGSNQIRFSVKALGDDTRKMQDIIAVGDEVTIEGPYGYFDFNQSQSSHQIWIAGGVGVTPFISWLESIQNHDQLDFNVDFYYSIKNKEEACLVPRLETLCENLSNINLHIHYSNTMGYLTSSTLPIQQNKQGLFSDIWFCGPSGFANTLKNGLNIKGFPVQKQFHQEIFQMR